MNQSETITKISPALVKAQGEMSNALKDSKNPFFKSAYADINSVREACMPSLIKHGISVLQPTVYIDGKPFVETVLLHESGEYISSLTEIICSKQNDAQSHGSGVSYARRYGLQSLCNLGTADDDGNAAVNTKREPAKETPKEEKKPLLEKGSDNWKNVVNALLKGTGTIEQVKSKYTVIEPNENELIELTKKNIK